MAKTQAGQVDVPRPAGALADADAARVAPRGIEQAELDGLGVLGEQREIDTLTIPMRAAREWRACGLVRPVVVGGDSGHFGDDLGTVQRWQRDQSVSGNHGRLLSPLKGQAVLSQISDLAHAGTVSEAPQPQSAGAQATCTPRSR